MCNLYEVNLDVVKSCSCATMRHAHSYSIRFSLSQFSQRELNFYVFIIRNFIKVLSRQPAYFDCRSRSTKLSLSLPNRRIALYLSFASFRSSSVSPIPCHHDLSCGTSKLMKIRLGKYPFFRFLKKCSFKRKEFSDYKTVSKFKFEVSSLRTIGVLPK